jgi:hypothetical protein
VLGKRLFLVCLAAGLVAAPAARAGTGLIVGVDDDSIEWATTTAQVVTFERALGLTAVRATITWSPGETFVADQPTRLELHRMSQATRLGERVVLSVYGAAAAPPTTSIDRADYCAFVLDALQRAPGVNDVVIWNEANNASFWGPKPNAAAYEALLAQCYDTLHARLPGVNVISSTSPHQDPATFIAALGAAYRASGRTQPIFDTFGHNAYPQNDAESPAKVHGARSRSLDEGDYGRLMSVLQSAFGGTGQPVPGEGSVRIWYLEDGFQTQIPSNELSFYTGTEDDRDALPAVAPPAQEESTPVDQATQLSTAIELAYCQPAVGAFFNFQLADDRSLGGWQSGVLWASWTPKPSYDAVHAAIEAVAAGDVDCSRFGAAVG